MRYALLTLGVGLLVVAVVVVNDPAWILVLPFLLLLVLVFAVAVYAISKASDEDQ